jgi:hypothetical protein
MQRGSKRRPDERELGFLDSHARRVAVGELDAGFFESGLDCLQRSRLQLFAGFQPGNSARGDFGHRGEFQHANSERGSRHSALGGGNCHRMSFLS